MSLVSLKIFVIGQELKRLLIVVIGLLQITQLAVADRQLYMGSPRPADLVHKSIVILGHDAGKSQLIPENRLLILLVLLVPETDAAAEVRSGQVITEGGIESVQLLLSDFRFAGSSGRDGRRRTDDPQSNPHRGGETLHSGRWLLRFCRRP